MNEDRPVSVIADTSGIYVTGYSNSGGILYAYDQGSTTQYKSIDCSGSIYNTFIAKYDTGGNVVWLTKISSSLASKPHKLVKSENSISVIGTYSGNMLNVYNEIEDNIPKQSLCYPEYVTNTDNVYIVTYDA